MQSSAANSYINFVNSNNGQGYIGYEVQDMNFYTANNERMRIDSSGRLLVGITSTAGSNEQLQVMATTGAQVGLGKYANDTRGAYFQFHKSRGSLGNHGLVSSGDEAGQIIFNGSDSAFYRDCARIEAWIDGTATTGGAMPGRLVFTTTATGATSGTERMRIDSSGVLRLGTGTAFNATKMAIAIPNNSTNGIFMGPTSTPSSGAFLGSVYFGNAGRTDGKSCSIEAIATGTHDPGTHNRGKLQFRTCAPTTTDPDIRLTIDEDGILIKAGNSSSARIVPQTDNAGYIGEASHRWQAIYAVNGTIQTSDEREKTEIVDSPLGTDFIKSLRPVAYKWKIGGYDHAYDEDRNDIFTPVAGTRTHYGFIAQEVRQAAGDTDFGGWLLEDLNDPDSKQSLRLHEFISPMVKALQEAIGKIETLETANASLEARLTALEGAG